MSIVQLLEDARAGKLPSCTGCPWNPIRIEAEYEDRKVPFGISCKDHGANYELDNSVISVQIQQDPSNTTPEETGRLCPVHNSDTPTDATARNSYNLWNFAVAKGEIAKANKYIARSYFTNAVMHGAPKSHEHELVHARFHCAEVLRDQLTLLRPKVIISCGRHAFESLKQIGVLEGSWSKARLRFPTGAYSEVSDSLGFQARVFCTYHTSARAVSGGAAKNFTDATGSTLSRATESRLIAGNIEENFPSKGLKVLLLHWIDIGDAIREAHSS